MPVFNLMDLKRDELAGLVDAQTVGVLPVAAKKSKKLKKTLHLLADSF